MVATTLARPACCDAVSLIALRHFDPRLIDRSTAAPGSSIAEIVRNAFPGRPADSLRVTIGDEVVPADRWGGVRPKAGTVVVLRAIPRGDQAMLRNVLLLAVTVAALAIGQLWLGPMIAGAFNAGGFGASLITGMTTSALPIGGIFLCSSAIPERGAL